MANRNGRRAIHHRRRGAVIIHQETEGQIQGRTARKAQKAQKPKKGS